MAIAPVIIEASAYRVPVETPVRTSFGVMRDRPAVIVRAVDADGVEGWGEAWCNFPTVGAEHRARLIAETVAPLVISRRWADPPEAFAAVSRPLEVLAIQSGEPGPIAQAIAGVDLALWDLWARKRGLPLYRALGGAEADSVGAYASGLNPDHPEVLAQRRAGEGHRAFKLKIGFGRSLDMRNLEAMRATLGEQAVLMVDANQAFDPESAKTVSSEIARFGLRWLEEPLRADQPWSVWRDLAEASPVPLAGGENLRGAQLDEAISSGVFAVIQPDIAKWGGLSGNLPIVRRALAAGRLFCPHWLAGGIGLLASLHLLAASGGDGLLEIDANPNPLREWLAGDLATVRDGRVGVPQGPGLGLVPDLSRLVQYRTWQGSASCSAER
jgi:L-alanine-DL-glutamate epimerase-like enolase superfamily enzyme